MSTQLKNASVPRADEFAPSPATKPRTRSRLPRWVRYGTPFAVLALGAAIEACILLKNAEDATFQVMQTWYAASLLVLALLVWWTLLSGFSWTVRLAGLGLVLLANLAFLGTFRLKEFSGNMLPNFEGRWQRSAEEKAADYWRNETTELAAALPGKDSSVVVEQLTIGPDDWPQFNGPRRDGRADSVRIRPGWEEGQPRKLSDFEPRPPRQLWRHPVGPAWSSFAVVDNFAFTQEQRGADEAVVCYDARNGKQIWAHLDQNQRFDQAMAGIGPRRRPRFTTRASTLSAPRAF